MPACACSCPRPRSPSAIFRDAQRHAELVRRSRDEMLAEIATLEKSQDELLDRLAAESR